MNHAPSHWWIAVLVGCILFSGTRERVLAESSGGAAQETPDIVNQLDESIWSVATGGLWKSDAEYGTYRIVVVASGSEHVLTKVFIQKLRFDDSKELYEVEQVAPVEELNSSFSVVVGVAYLETPREANFRLSVRDRDSEMVRDVTLKLKSDLDYQISQSPPQN